MRRAGGQRGAVLIGFALVVPMVLAVLALALSVWQQATAQRDAVALAGFALEAVAADVSEARAQAAVEAATALAPESDFRIAYGDWVVATDDAPAAEASSDPGSLTVAARIRGAVVRLAVPVHQTAESSRGASNNAASPIGTP